MPSSSRTRSDPPQPVVYLDHASTSWPKPPEVLAALGSRLGDPAPAPGDEVSALCADLRSLTGASPDTHCRLVGGGRDALARLLCASLAPGDHVITTVFDHDAVRETLAALQQYEVTTTVLPCRPGNHGIDPADLDTALQTRTALVAAPQVSNVTGAVLEITELARVCAARQVPIVVDAAQAVGRVPCHFEGLGAAALAASTHKALRGPRRTGFVLLSDAYRGHLGRRGEVIDPAARRDLLESPPDQGLCPALIAAAAAGLRSFIAECRQAGADSAQDERIADALAALQSVPGLTLYGPRDPRGRVGIFGFSWKDCDALELAGRLRSQGWWVAGGTQRSSWLHEALGTVQRGGLVRISLGSETTRQQIADVTAALVTAAEERP